MSAVELATAYISLIPSLKGASESISQQMTPAAGKAGTDGGNAMGSMLMGGLKKFALPIAGIVAGFSVKKFISESTASFETLATSVKGFGRIAGGSVAQYSGLAGAMKVGGVDVDAASGAMTIFSKNLGNASQDASKTQAMVAKLGTSFLDAKGQVKPMSDILPGLADKFKTMPDGAEKTALAMQLFGRSGAQMIPFLNQGSAGIGQLTEKAKEMGLVMDDQSMRILVAAKASARDYTNAITGMKAALGQTLLPVMTAVSNIGRQIMIPVFETLTKVFTAGRDPILGLAGHIQDFANKAGAAVQVLMAKIGPEIVPMLEKMAASIGSILMPLAPLIPKMLELAGSFSPLSMVFSQLGPQIPLIIESIIKIAGVLTGALGEALKVVLPILADLAVKLAEGFAQVASEALPGLQEGLSKLLPMITGVTERLTSNTSIIYGAITAWAIWSAVTSAIELGGTIAGLTESIKAWGGLITKIKEATIVQWLMNFAQANMPLLIIIAGIALLIGAIVIAYNNIGWFKDGVDAAFKWIQDVVGSVVSWFQTDALPFITEVWNGILSAAAVVAEWYQGHLAPVFEAFGQLIGTVFDGITGYFTNSSSESGGAWASLWEKVQAIWAVVAPILETAIAVVFGNIAATFKFIWDVIVAVFSFVWNQIVTVLNMALGIIQGVIMVVTGIISGNWGMVWEGIQTIFGAIWTGIVSTLSNVLNFISSMIGAGLNLVSSIVGNVLGGIAQFFGSTWSDISNSVQGFIDGLIGFFRDLPGQIMGALGNIGGWLIDSGRALIQGFIDGIRGMASGIGDAVGGIMDFAKSFFPHSPAKRGPFSGSGYTSFSGQALAKDFAKGIASQNDVVAEAAAGIMTSASLTGHVGISGALLTGPQGRGAGVTNNWTINQVDDPLGTSHAIARRQNAMAV